MTQRSAGFNGNRYDFIQVIVVNAPVWLLFPFNLSMSLRIINYSARSSRHKLAIYAIYLARLWYFHHCTWKVGLLSAFWDRISFGNLWLFEAFFIQLRLNEKLRHSATFNRTFSFAKKLKIFGPRPGRQVEIVSAQPRLWYLTSHLS